MACNLYITTEPEYKIKLVFINAKNFYILDVERLIKSLGLDPTEKAGIYLINKEIQRLITYHAQLKKVLGIIYIVKHISEKQVLAIKKRFCETDDILDFVLIDNALTPQHSDVMSMFDEVVFYERFKRNKIVICNQMDKLMKTDEKSALEVLFDNMDS